MNHTLNTHKGSTMDEQDSGLDFSFVLASSVHDMKNSLGMLLHTLESMLADSPPENDAQRKTFSVLGYEASRINSELVQLLTLYRMQHESLRVQIDEHHVMDLLEDQVDRNDVLFQARDLEVTVNCDPDLKWYFDSELLGGVINNILVNCARYSRSQLMISAEVTDRGLDIRIADDGQGYPQSMLDAPLEMNAGVSFSSGSTNLGLLFASRIVQLHRARGTPGSLELANHGPLGGGILTLTLP